MASQDIVNVDVVFRFFRKEIIALFPYEIWSGYDVTSYAHVGQHSGADYKGVVNSSRPASVGEYLPLLQELQSIGYNVTVINKRNTNSYLNAVHAKDKV